MSWLGFFVLVGLIVFGWYAYRELKAMEDDVRRDIERKNAPTVQPVKPPAKKEDAVPAQMASPAVEDELARKLIPLIAARPGILQTELYAELAEFNRKRIQERLLELDRAGTLRREKAQGSYRVYLA